MSVIMVIFIVQCVHHTIILCFNYIISGNELPNILIRVGNDHDGYRYQKGHDSNIVCLRWLSGPVSLGGPHGLHLECEFPVKGQYLSIETDYSKTDDGRSFGQLVLCEVEASFK